jgi:hypothetical protein
MKLSGFPFEITDWSKVPGEKHAGEKGVATWRTRNFGDVRVRMVEYSAGYLADHWCEKGHIVLCVEGEFTTEHKDGTSHILKSGMSYQVADGAEPHRSFTKDGAKLFIVD